MKLKLELINTVSCLILLPEGGEALSIRHATVVKAGLTKLIATGKTQVVLDLSQAPEVAPDAQAAFLELQGWSPTPPQKVELLIAATFGPFADPKIAAGAITDGVYDLVLQEFKLTQRKARLEALRAKSAAKLEALGASETAQKIQALKKQNGLKRREVKLLETALRRWKEASSLPPSPEKAGPLATNAEGENVRKLLLELFKTKKYFEALKTPNSLSDAPAEETA